jgi:MFS family permease
MSSIAVTSADEQVNTQARRLPWLWLYVITMPFTLAIYVWSDSIDRSRLDNSHHFWIVTALWLLIAIPGALLLESFGRSRLLALSALLLVFATPFVLGAHNDAELVIGRLLISCASTGQFLGLSTTLLDHLESRGNAKGFVLMFGGLLAIETFLRLFVAWPTARALNESGLKSALFISTIAAGMLAFAFALKLPRLRNDTPIKSRAIDAIRAMRSERRLFFVFGALSLIGEARYLSCVVFHRSSFYWPELSSLQRGLIYLGSIFALLLGFLLAFSFRTGPLLQTRRFSIALLLIGGATAGRLDSGPATVLYCAGYFAVGATTPILFEALLQAVPRASRLVLLSFSVILVTAVGNALTAQPLDANFTDKVFVFAMACATLAAVGLILVLPTRQRSASTFTPDIAAPQVSS